MLSSSPPLLSAQNVGKSFSGVAALRGVALDLHAGEIHALVGENGAGKSTLMKILGGVYPHGEYDGEIRLEGALCRFHSPQAASRAGIAVMHQELALVKEMTVAENLYLGAEIGRGGFVDHAAMLHGASATCARLGFPLDAAARVGDLGIAEQQLVEIARALRSDHRVLILDEPTAALSETETAMLFAHLRTIAAQGTAVVFISHKLDEVFQLSDRITVLRDGCTIRTDATPAWDRRSLIQAMVGRPVEEMFLRRESPTGDVVLDVRDLTVHDPAIPGRRILDRVSLSVRAGEVVCVAGLMGAGRTELLSSIFGRRVGVRTGGTISLHGVPLDSSGPGSAIARGVGLVPEDRKNEGIVPSLSVTDNLALVHGSAFSSAGFLRSVALTAACRSLVDRLHIKVPGLDAAVEALSGGNQQKVALGKWFLGAPGLLLLDEPTRGIDVGAKAELYALINALAASGVALLVVSSDLPEVIGLADRILVLRRGRVAGELHGTVTQEQIMELAA